MTRQRSTSKRILALPAGFIGNRKAGVASKTHFQSIDQVVEELNSNLYIADRALATVVFLAHRLRKPLFLEGEPGVGKTEVGTVMAKLLNTELIRLQCYEGLGCICSPL
jgi:MoxR-like ATPase